MLHSVAGLENAKLMRPGYAIEYDVVIPHQLRASLETKLVRGLYTAGQMNGTSGYEEAAGQGLIAGINAARQVQGQDPLIIKRSDGYIGVMIDDLVTKGTTEPYRLLTSRAEYRLLLRHDNADLRLTEIGHQIGLVDDQRYATYLAKKALVDAEIKRLKKITLTPKTPGLEELFERVGSSSLLDGISAFNLLKRPEIRYLDLVTLIPRPEGPLERQEAEQVEIQIKYEGYIQKAIEKVEKVKAMEEKRIPEDIDYDAILNLANEARDRLKLIQPTTLAQASRVSGVNPADIAILSVYIQQGKIARLQDRQSQD